MTIKALGLFVCITVLGMCSRFVYATADEADAYVLQMFFFVFFVFVFFRSPQNMRQPFSGTAERIFIKLLPNDTGDNGVSNVVPKLGLGPK